MASDQICYTNIYHHITAETYLAGWGRGHSVPVPLAGKSFPYFTYTWVQGTCPPCQMVQTTLHKGAGKLTDWHVSLPSGSLRGVQRHPRRLKMRHGNPRWEGGAKIRKLGVTKFTFLFQGKISALNRSQAIYRSIARHRGIFMCKLLWNSPTSIFNSKIFPVGDSPGRSLKRSRGRTGREKGMENVASWLSGGGRRWTPRNLFSQNGRICIRSRSRQNVTVWDA